MQLRKCIPLALAIGLCLPQAHAAQIAFTDVTGIGTYTNSLSLLTNGVFPSEGATWNGTTSVWFSRYSAAADTEYFVFDMGSRFTVTDISLSVDNNDSYTVEYSANGSSWSVLTVADRSFGEIGNGMDTLTTIAGNPEYVAGMDFVPTGPARYLRIYVDGWANVTLSPPQYSVPFAGDGAYAIGEFQAFGDAYVPLPSAGILLASAVAGLIGFRRRVSASG